MNKVLCLVFLLCVGVLPSKAQKDIMAPTPPMGWISWNLFEGNISEDLVMQIADAMVESGMKEAGYQYIILDDLWEGGRDKNGIIFADPKKFPSGMKNLADYIHAKGLKFGIYTDAAEWTCGGAVGTFGYEKQDAQTFAQWGVDYVKCDYCGAPADLDTARKRYKKFIDEVRATGREMVFAICEWGQRSPWLWGKEVGGNLWRTTWDLRDTWEHGKYSNGHNGIMEALDRQVGLEKYAGPGHWNDPDMLVIGLKGKGKSASANGASGCSVREYEGQMGLWSLLSAPLLTTCDIRNMDADTKRILTNKEIIAVNQDPLGKQASRIMKRAEKEIWAKPLANGDWAVGFLNRDDSRTRKITLDLKQVKMENVQVRDLWKHKDMGVSSKKVTMSVKPHECKMIILKKAK